MIQKQPDGSSVRTPDFVKTRKLLSKTPAVFYSGHHVQSKKKVALVRYINYRYKHQDMITEMVYMQQLQDVNILKFLTTTVGAKPHHQYLVYEHFTHFLSDIFMHIDAVSLPIIKNIFVQLLEGIDYLHTKSIVHRDIHPQTVVFNSMGVLKLSSFRNACSENCVGHAPRTRQYGYQGPEVLLNLKVCSSVADVWSAICILVELTTKRPLFSHPPNATVSGVVKQILVLLGVPDTNIWPNLMDHPERNLLLVKNIQSISYLSEYLRDRINEFFSEKFVNLIKNGLQYDPSLRFTAKKCLDDPYITAGLKACSTDEISFFLKTIVRSGETIGNTL